MFFSFSFCSLFLISFSVSMYIICTMLVLRFEPLSRRFTIFHSYYYYYHYYYYRHHHHDPYLILVLPSASLSLRCVFTQSASFLFPSFFGEGIPFFFPASTFVTRPDSGEYGRGGWNIASQLQYLGLFKLPVAASFVSHATWAQSTRWNNTKTCWAENSD